MGLFDSVYAGCPRCGKNVEFQSKADEDPYMNSYTIETAPTHILTDVLNDPHYCRHCGCWLALVDPAFAASPSSQSPLSGPSGLQSGVVYSADDYDDLYDDYGCANCDGEGFVYGCSWDWQCDTWDGDSCLCTRRCDWCNPIKPDPALQTVLADALAAGTRSAETTGSVPKGCQSGPKGNAQ